MRLQRQANIVATLKAKAKDGVVLTVGQVIYFCGLSASGASREAVIADLQALYERGIVARQKVTSKTLNRRVWAYWVKM